MARLPLYFFLRVSPDDDEKPTPLLHKRLYVNRPADLVTTWCYPLHKRVTYTYSDTLRKYEKAFTTKQVGQLIHRSIDRIAVGLEEGGFAEPQYTYGFSEHQKKHAYMWHEDNIMDVHDYFLTVHRGRPRLDGKITPQYMPTKRELRAMIRQEELLYVKGEDGEFRPVWTAQDFS